MLVSAVFFGKYEEVELSVWKNEVGRVASERKIYHPKGEMKLTEDETLLLLRAGADDGAGVCVCMYVCAFQGLTV